MNKTGYIILLLLVANLHGMSMKKHKKNKNNPEAMEAVAEIDPVEANAENPQDHSDKIPLRIIEAPVICQAGFVRVNDKCRRVING